MPKLGVPVSTAPWEAPADDDPLSHWLAGARPRRLRRWMYYDSERGGIRPAPRDGDVYRDPTTGRETVTSLWP